MRRMYIFLITIMVVTGWSVIAAAQNGPSLASTENGVTLASLTPASTAITVPGSAARVDFSAFTNGGQMAASASNSGQITSELMLQADGWFTRDSLQSGIPHISTDSAGLNIGYRHFINSWVAAEVNYDYGRIANKYTNAGTSLTVQSKINGITANLVVGPNNAIGFRPFALAGGGVLIFSPTNKAGGTVPGNARQTRGAFDFGAGIDLALSSRIALRVEYRGFVYKVPDFGLATLHTNKTTLSSVPSAGVIIAF